MCFSVLLAMSCMYVSPTAKWRRCFISLCSPTAKWRRCFISLCSPTAKWRRCFINLCSPTAKWRRCFINLCSPTAEMAAIVWVFCSSKQNGGSVVFFSRRSKNGGRTCLFPQCLWGKGASAANAVELRPLMADTPWPRPLPLTRLSPTLTRLTPTSTTPPPPTPRMNEVMSSKLINDKWSNCGSDDSSCKYWRKNSYHLILIIFLLSHIKQVGCAGVGFKGPDPTTLWETAERLQYFWEITMLLFIHHYVLMNNFIWTLNS